MDLEWKYALLALNEMQADKKTLQRPIHFFWPICWICRPSYKTLWYQNIIYTFGHIWQRHRFTLSIRTQFLSNCNIWQIHRLRVNETTCGASCRKFFLCLNIYRAPHLHPTSTTLFHSLYWNFSSKKTSKSPWYRLVFFRLLCSVCWCWIKFWTQTRITRDSCIWNTSL